MYAGIDHSTTGVKVGLVEDNSTVGTFILDRAELAKGEVSFTQALNDHVDAESVERVAIGYSYGDGLAAIKDAAETENRGNVDTAGLGHRIGGGTVVFDELVDSDIPCTAFPGIHDKIECLHPYFRYYSHITGADKIAMTRYAQEVMRENGGSAENFISACVSSSCMATLVHDGAIKGAFHALGLIHGFIDVETVRKVQADEMSLQDIFMKCGLLYQSGASFEDIMGVPDKNTLQMLYWATLHHIYSLVPFSAYMSNSVLEGIVLSGRLSRVETPFEMRERLQSAFSGIAPTHTCQEHSTALGAAYIARDVHRGASDVLGLPVVNN